MMFPDSTPMMDGMIHVGEEDKDEKEKRGGGVELVPADDEEHRLVFDQLRPTAEDDGDKQPAGAVPGAPARAAMAQMSQDRVADWCK